MSCTGCSIAVAGGKPAGCGSKGNCLTGGCNRLNTYDWLAHLPVPGQTVFPIHEISFKNGVRKGFYVNKNHLDILTGDMVVVESEGGYDTGKISLSGELVKLQMKKRKVAENSEFLKIMRKASDTDLQKLLQCRAMEGATMLRARVLARELKLEMKIGDVEFHGDKRKATFYYTADDRVDFRELIKLFAKEFHIKIEMRQIGARQEAGKIGGIGSCGRELCCSTWLTDFKSVSTTAARYQNLSINQSKLSGQCGRLKCCLNYELDTYLDALEEFPKDAEVLQTAAGQSRLIKTDIFKKLMIYESNSGGKQYALNINRVKEIQQLNKNGEKPESLEAYKIPVESTQKFEFAEVTGQISLKTIERAEKKRQQEKNRHNQQNKNKQAKSNRQQKNQQIRNQENKNQHSQPNSEGLNKNKGQNTDDKNTHYKK